MQTAERFFSENKKYATKVKNLNQKLVEFQIKSMVAEEGVNVGVIKSDDPNSQVYFSMCPTYIEYLVKSKKGIIYYNEGFIYGLFGDQSIIDEKKFREFCESFKPESDSQKDKGEAKEKKEATKFKYAMQDKINLGKKNVVSNIYQISCFTTFNLKLLQDKFNELKFKSLD